MKTSATNIVVRGVCVSYFVLVPLFVRAYSSPQLTVDVEKPACTRAKFHNLKAYAEQHWRKVFRDKKVSTALRSLLKSDYRKLVESMQQASYPEDPDEPLSFVDGEGVLILRGFVPGLFTIMEAMLVVEPCGNIYAVILDSGDKFLYFTNDKKYTERLPDAIEQWRSSIEKARSGFEKRPQLPIVYKSKK